MDNNPSRREFLKAGLVVPAAGVAAPRLQNRSQTPPGVSYRILGRAGLKVSTVGLGSGYNPKPDVIAHAVELGINYFDTARSYGDSERVMGGALKAYRDKILIATKGGGRTKEDLFKEMDTSLQMLGTDHVDVYLLHGVDTPDRITDEVLDGLETLKQRGKTRAIGISTHDPNNVVDRVVKAGNLDVVMLTYSYPIGGVFRDAAIKKLNAAGIGVVAMKVVRAVSGIRMMEEMRNGATLADIRKAYPQPKPPEHGLAAIKWALLNPALATTIPDHASLANLEMNARAMTESYTASDERLLFALNEQIRPLYCRMCYQCRGQCPNGMPVTDVLRYLAYNDFGGNYHQARQYFSELPGEIRKVRCSDCSSCAVECPNGVAVRDRLIRAQALLA
jgi:predicted aldo/keto reductase-like oxidoreductase